LDGIRPLIRDGEAMVTVTENGLEANSMCSQSGRMESGRRVYRRLAERTIEKCRRRTGVALTVLTLVGGGLLFGPEAASAQTCIQDVWQAHGNSQDLTCTANDVTLSSATNINILTGGSCDPVTGVCRCFAGQTVTFTADFQMDLTAQTRFDVGFYIATDGDPNNDGAITGQCTATASLSTNTGNFINLDAAPDVCGDITGPFGTANNPLFVTAQISTECPTTPGEQLVLPFATTWRQPGSNEVCDGTGNGTTTNDVFPGSPSKCNSGTLAIDIFAEPVAITVTKDAQTPSVPETGGSATYLVTVTNNGPTLPLTLTSLVDAPFGDITTVHDAVTATTCVPDMDPATCEIGGSIAPAGGTCSCTFTATVPPGDFPGSFPDVVTGCGTNEITPTPACDDDPAEVPYSDVEQPPTLTKAASPQCQIDVTYNVVVNNGSAQDALTLNTLSDNVYGDITQVQGSILSTTCAVPQTIAPAGNFSCSFVARITSCETTVMDTVEGTATDDDGANYTVSGQATVVVSVTGTP
jgi:hypothetical protein